MFLVNLQVDIKLGLHVRQ